MKTTKKKWSPPETKLFLVGGGTEIFDLIGGNTDAGFTTKSQADKLASEWKAYPKDARARVLKIKDRYWVYGN